MFPAKYFAPRYFAPRYWPKTGAVSAATVTPASRTWTPKARYPGDYIICADPDDPYDIETIRTNTVPASDRTATVVP